MTKKHYIGPAVFWALTLLVVPMWFISYPHTTLRHELSETLIYTSQITALVGFSLFGFTFILSARIKFLERWFGGLDKMYHTHHNMGKLATLALFIHPLTLSIAWAERNVDKALWFMFPVHRRMEINVGAWALWILVLLIVFTIAIKLPYDKWKLSHKLMGIPFLLGIGHIFYTDGIFQDNLILWIYVALVSILGTSAYLYKSWLYPWLSKAYPYRVDEIQYLTDKAMEIALVPQVGRAMKFIPGQFAFFSFQSKNLSLESHPYTIVRDQKGVIYIMVKKLGDYTSTLYHSLKRGTKVSIDGPYGGFDFSRGSRRQIWIGGGIGIAPFISWLHHLQEHPKPHINCRLYYCVLSKKDACYYRELEVIVSKLPNVELELICNDTDGFLDPANIPDLNKCHIFLCGPKEMRKSLTRQMRSTGVRLKQIHTEDFDFV